jgi:hypothetical protein
MLVEAASRFCCLVGYAFVVYAVGGGCVACMLGRAETLASTPVSKGY